jgi:hypothetical protein
MKLDHPALLLPREVGRNVYPALDCRRKCSVWDASGIVPCHAQVGSKQLQRCRTHNTSLRVLLLQFVGFEVLTPVAVTPYSPLEVHRRLGETFQHLQNRKRSQERNQAVARSFHAGVFVGLLFPEDGGDMCLRNVCSLLTVYTAICLIAGCGYVPLSAVSVASGRFISAVELETSECAVQSLRHLPSNSCGCWLDDQGVGS